MKRYLVKATWWVDAESEDQAINMVENAVAKMVESELQDSEVEDEEECDGLVEEDIRRALEAGD